MNIGYQHRHNHPKHLPICCAHTIQLLNCRLALLNTLAAPESPHNWTTTSAKDTGKPYSCQYSCQ